MATSDDNTAELQRWQTTAADHYAGTKEQLVATGICEARWFPVKLTPMIRQDGTPKLDGYGKQRIKRVYVVERQPETILTHRRCADGTDKWIVQVAVDDSERKRREQVEHETRQAEWEEQEERNREREEQKARARDAARPTVIRLRARYPELFDIRGEVFSMDDGTRRQFLEFYARTLEALVRYGLVTDEMLPVEENGSYRCGDLRDGRSFWLQQGNDYFYIRLETAETPKERKHFPVTEARLLLKQIVERRPAP